MKKIWMALCCVLCFSMTAAADDVGTVENLLKEKTDAVLTLLKEKNIAEQEKKDRIMAIVGPIIDFPLMAKLTLGKTNWGKLNSEQQAQFVDLFVQRLKRSYLDKASFYDNEKIKFNPGVQSGNKVHVPMEILTKEKPIEVLYKFYHSGNGWMAYDIEINGVSLIKSYQAQFSEVLNTGTAEDLINELKKTETQ